MKSDDIVENNETGDGRKSSRKAEKKTARALAILRRDTGIAESAAEATRVIFVCNAGLVTGCASSDLLKLFSKHGPVTQIILIPQKSYSFVVFGDELSASKAFHETHGKVGFSDKGPLYLAFVDKAPDFDDPWGDGSPSLPPGLEIVPNFVSEAEEENILQCFNWDEGTKETHLKHRQVKHYGYEFSYVSHDIDPGGQLVLFLPRNFTSICRPPSDGCPHPRPLPGCGRAGGQSGPWRAGGRPADGQQIPRRPGQQHSSSRL